MFPSLSYASANPMAAEANCLSFIDFKFVTNLDTSELKILGFMY